ncbi:response regulator [Aeoliella sp.]|uniref:response regulator n=1 Tax=Aeoliella sp. TaxID=2795800 RepID=UPI003CCC19BC
MDSVVVVGFVEDSDLDFEMSAQAVATQREGVQLVRASSIAEADVLLTTTGLRGLIVDVNLPDGSGIEFVRRIKSDGRYADLPVAVFSTSFANADREAARKAGAVAYSEKPFDTETFVRRVLSLIDRIV